MYPYGRLFAQKNDNGNDETLRTLLVEAMEDEKTDSDYYGRLSEKIEDKADSDLVKSFKADELKHFNMMSGIYNDLYGRVPTLNPKTKEVYRNLSDNFYKSVLGELEGADFYRSIYFIIKDKGYGDELFEMMTDEQGHAAKMNYLYAKYK